MFLPICQWPSAARWSWVCRSEKLTSPACPRATVASLEQRQEQIPKADGFERRQKLYKLYHYLNQLNLFGDPKVRETVETLTGEILSDLEG